MVFFWLIVADNVLLCRPEVRFPSLSALIAQINADKGIAKTQLETEQHCQYKNDTFFETWGKESSLAHKTYRLKVHAEFWFR